MDRGKRTEMKREGLPSRISMADEFSIKTKCQGLASGLFSQRDSLEELPITLFYSLHHFVVYTCICMSLD